MNLRQAAEMALEVLENLQGGCTDSDDGTVEAITVWCPEIIDALREALAQPEQEPVAWMVHGGEIWNTSVSPYRDERGIPLYTHPAPIPEGWQLVPIEPTDHMRAEGRETYRNDGDELDIWLTMLAAAPKPEDV